VLRTSQEAHKKIHTSKCHFLLGSKTHGEQNHYFSSLDTIPWVVVAKILKCKFYIIGAVSLNSSAGRFFWDSQPQILRLKNAELLHPRGNEQTRMYRVIDWIHYEELTDPRSPNLFWRTEKSTLGEMLWPLFKIQLFWDTDILLSPPYNHQVFLVRFDLFFGISSFHSFPHTCNAFNNATRSSINRSSRGGCDVIDPGYFHTYTSLIVKYTAFNR